MNIKEIFEVIKQHKKNREFLVDIVGREILYCELVIPEITGRPYEFGCGERFVIHNITNFPNEPVEGVYVLFGFGERPILYDERHFRGIPLKTVVQILVLFGISFRDMPSQAHLLLGVDLSELFNF